MPSVSQFPLNRTIIRQIKQISHKENRANGHMKIEIVRPNERQNDDAHIVVREIENRGNIRSK